MVFALVVQVEAGDFGLLRSGDDKKSKPSPVVITIPLTNIEMYKVDGTAVGQATGAEKTTYANAPIYNSVSNALEGVFSATVACQRRSRPGQDIRSCQWNVAFTQDDVDKSSLSFLKGGLVTSQTGTPDIVNDLFYIAQQTKTIRSVTGDGVYLGKTYDLNVVIDTTGTKSLVCTFTPVNIKHD